MKLPVAIALLLLALPAFAAGSVRFALFGDTPYSAYEREQLPGLIRDMAEWKVDFAIHDGDIKNGHSRCDDGLYADILGAFQASVVPLVYVPGDNEWTDCARPDCGRYDQRERLAFLRKTFFPDERTLGRSPMKVVRQTGDGHGYPENSRWQTEDVLFVTLNIPGFDNNVGNAEEFEARDAANRAWLREAFHRARRAALKGIVIVIQANPFLEADNEGKTKPGFQPFLDLLRSETAAFAGQVVLVHGDTHHMQIDKPLKDRTTGETIGNFTRVETYGSPFMGWIEGIADPADPAFFRFETHPWPAADRLPH